MIVLPPDFSRCCYGETQASGQRFTVAVIVARVSASASLAGIDGPPLESGR